MTFSQNDSHILYCFENNHYPHFIVLFWLKLSQSVRFSSEDNNGRYFPCDEVYILATLRWLTFWHWSLYIFVDFLYFFEDLLWIFLKYFPCFGTIYVDFLKVTWFSVDFFVDFLWIFQKIFPVWWGSYPGNITAAYFLTLFLYNWTISM